jgi:lysophospholipase L1-like esterase
MPNWRVEEEIAVKKALKISLVLLGLMLIGVSWPAWQVYQEIRKSASEDPLVWEADIVALETATRGQCPRETCVVFVGSSSIRFWDTLAADMSPMRVIQHGFGGAKLNDIVYYAPRLVNDYRPRAVVVFAGTNDIDPRARKDPAVLLERYQAFVRVVDEAMADLPIYYIGITPSPMRWSVWPVALEANRLIKEWSGTRNNLHFIDTSEVLLDEDGKPDDENYVIDGLHLSDKGYGRWTAVIRPRLLEEIGAERQE